MYTMAKNDIFQSFKLDRTMQREVNSLKKEILKGGGWGRIAGLIAV